MWLGVKSKDLEEVRGQWAGPGLEVGVSLRESGGGARSNLEEKNQQSHKLPQVLVYLQKIYFDVVFLNE